MCQRCWLLLTSYTDIQNGMWRLQTPGTDRISFGIHLRHNLFQQRIQLHKINVTARWNVCIMFMVHRWKHCGPFMERYCYELTNYMVQNNTFFSTSFWWIRFAKFGRVIANRARHLN
jgi:hypothetical protein